jgi:hypothetical protein
MEKRILPDFKSEAEEAKWWFDNQDELDKDFAVAAAEGRLLRGDAVVSGEAGTNVVKLNSGDGPPAKGKAPAPGLKYRRGA